MWYHIHSLTHLCMSSACGANLLPALEIWLYKDTSESPQVQSSVSVIVYRVEICQARLTLHLSCTM